ncbi:MAG: aminoacyl-tRNA hydrolase, partial [Chloroflexia bacterium]|nr:aminoacyl-tRNA hydrolase [Chloroflexia bacterium]
GGGGGAAGHKGMRSIIESLGTDEFPRLRIGIGRPADPQTDPIDYVLRPFRPAEEAILANSLDRAVEAIVCLLNEGLDMAMSRYNRPAEREG